MLGLGVLDAVVAPGLRRRSPGASSCSAALNVILAGISLLPGMPLDGGRVVRALAWARTKDRDRAGAVTARVGRLLGFTVIGVGIAMALADLATEGLLVIALGWLLTTGARTLDRRLALERLLRGVDGPRGDGGRPAVGRAEPHRRHVRGPLRGPGRRPGDARRRGRARPRHHRPPPPPAAGPAPVRVHPRVRGHGHPAAGAGPRARRPAVGGAGHDEQRGHRRARRSPSRAGWPGCSPATACPRPSARRARRRRGASRRRARERGAAVGSRRPRRRSSPASHRSRTRSRWRPRRRSAASWRRR